MLILVRHSTTMKSVAALVITGCVSVSPAFGNTLTVQNGQSLWTIAKKEHVSVKSLESANPSVNPNNLLVGTRLQIPSAAPAVSTSTYVMKPGDTLWRVAQRYHLSLNSIIHANPGLKATNVLVGTRIHIPTTTTVSHAIAKTSTTTLAQSNLYWMEHVINAEAGGQPLQTQIAVGDVILHRLQSGKYGSSVKDVVFQISYGHYQFTTVANGYIYTAPCATSIKAANAVLGNHEDVVPGAYVFYDPAHTPSGSWVWSQPKIAQIGDMVFAK